MRRVLILAALLAGSASPAIAGGDSRPRAVVELFTSQGCSSCPEADRLLGRLAEDPGLVALSFPVTYWDYLGWKDTLARPEFTERQRAYAGERRDRGIALLLQTEMDGRPGAILGAATLYGDPDS